MGFWNSKQDTGPQAATKISTSSPHRDALTANPHGGHSRNATSPQRRGSLKRCSADANVGRRSHRLRKPLPATASPFNKGEHSGSAAVNSTICHGSAVVHPKRSTPKDRISPDKRAKNELNYPDQSPTSGGDGLWSWIPHVTQSADDTTVSDRVKETFVFAEQFVNNFYSDRFYDGDIADETLERANSSALLSTRQLQQCLVEADYQTSLIKHVLTSLLLDLIAFDSIASIGSLLPKEFQNFTVLAKARSVSSTSADEIPHVQPALSAYRVLSAYIRSDVEEDQNYRQERQQVVEEITTTFERAFQYWIKRHRSRADRQATLHQLLDKVGSLGIFLFSQPSVFVFDWDMTPHDQSMRLIPVWPRLLRVFDNDAQLRAMSDHMIPMKCAAVFNDAADRQLEGP